jgi:DNA-directed RNA polymerase specialized sigma24 family protein
VTTSKAERAAASLTRGSVAVRKAHGLYQKACSVQRQNIVKAKEAGMSTAAIARLLTTSESRVRQQLMRAYGESHQ